MKKAVCVLLAFLLLTSFAGCGKSTDAAVANKAVGQTQGVNDVLNGATTTMAAANKNRKKAAAIQKASAFSEDQIQVDLTKLSSTMVYSEVYNMMNTPSDYRNKVVRMQGAFSGMEANDKVYYACVIADATACCAQGIEFELAGDYVYPQDYPNQGDEITVTGTFDIYYEGDSMYCTLRNAEMI